MRTTGLQGGRGRVGVPPCSGAQSTIWQFNPVPSVPRREARNCCYRRAIDRLEGKARLKPFVEAVLSYCFSIVDLLSVGEDCYAGPHVLEVTLQADNCFYSQQAEFERRGLPAVSSSYGLLPDFMVPSEIAKTGLGSSAALVTSLVGVLLHLHGVAVLPSVRNPDQAHRLDLTHNLAQLCHIVAQGKVGSGFDCVRPCGSVIYEGSTRPAAPVPQRGRCLQTDRSGNC